MTYNVLIKNIHDAIRHFRQTYCGGESRAIRHIQGDRGAIAVVVQCRSKLNYVMLKTAWFYSFSKIYPQVSISDVGQGQSFNMKMLEQAIEDEANLVCMMSDGNAYACPAILAYDYIITNHTSRIPSTEQNKEGSVPARMLAQLDRIIQV